MSDEEPESATQAAARSATSAVDGSAMSRLFARTSDSDDDPGDFDEVSLALTRAYCFSMDSGLGVARDALSKAALPGKRGSGG